MRTEVSRHFCSTNHTGTNDIEIFVLDFVYFGIPTAKQLSTRFKKHTAQPMRRKYGEPSGEVMLFSPMVDPTQEASASYSKEELPFQSQRP